MDKIDIKTMKALDDARWEIVWLICKKEWFIDKTNDELVRRMDELIKEVRIYIN
jgi:hypothetical protein